MVLPGLQSGEASSDNQIVVVAPEIAVADKSPNSSATIASQPLLASDYADTTQQDQYEAIAVLGVTGQAKSYRPADFAGFIPNGVASAAIEYPLYLGINSRPKATTLDKFPSWPVELTRSAKPRRQISTSNDSLARRTNNRPKEQAEQAAHQPVARQSFGSFAIATFQAPATSVGNPELMDINALLEIIDLPNQDQPLDGPLEKPIFSLPKVIDIPLDDIFFEFSSPGRNSDTGNTSAIVQNIHYGAVDIGMHFGVITDIPTSLDVMSTPVPEPSTGCLLIACALGLLRKRRKRQA